MRGRLRRAGVRVVQRRFPKVRRQVFEVPIKTHYRCYSSYRNFSLDRVYNLHFQETAPGSSRNGTRHVRHLRLSNARFVVLLRRQMAFAYEENVGNTRRDQLKLGCVSAGMFERLKHVLRVIHWSFDRTADHLDAYFRRL